MNSMGAQAVLAVLLLTIGTVEAAKGGVSFWRGEFTMTCPGDSNWKWHRNGKELTNQSSQSYTLPYSGDTKGLYYCKYNFGEDQGLKYYFYVEGKVCENCFEVNVFLLGVVIFADLIFTVFVMMAIYRCTKKKSPPAPAPVPHSSKAPPRSGGRGPNASTSASAYETLAPQTRADDTYSKINRKK